MRWLVLDIFNGKEYIFLLSWRVLLPCRHFNIAFAPRSAPPPPPLRPKAMINLLPLVLLNSEKITSCDPSIKSLIVVGGGGGVVC